MILYVPTSVYSSYGYYNIYCGIENCYSVLNVTRNATKFEIARRYRRLALQYHPDRNKDSNATDVYNLLTTAYDTLKDEAIRKEYDYFLDHPEQRYRNYYMYYQRNVQNYIDIRLVIFGFFIILSIIQYIVLKQNYERAIKDQMQNPKLHHQAKKQLHFKYTSENHSKKRKYIELENDEYEKILESLVKDSHYIKYMVKKPEIQSLLLFKAIKLPFTISYLIYWNVVWFYRYKLKKLAYNENDQEYLTKKTLNIDENRWKMLSNTEKTELVKMKLWIKDNLKSYNEKLEDYAREKLSKDNKHKIVKRYLRKNAGEPIVFDN